MAATGVAEKGRSTMSQIDDMKLRTDVTRRGPATLRRRGVLAGLAGVAAVPFLPTASASAATTVAATGPDPKLGVVQAYFNAILAGNITLAESYLSQNCVFNEAAGLPWGGQWTGPNGFVALNEAVAQYFNLAIQQVNLVTAGSRILADETLQFTSVATGKSIVMVVEEFYTTSANLITCVDPYYKDTRAISHLAGICT